MIRFLETKFEGVGCYLLVFYLAVFCLAGICEMFVDGVIIFDIYVALYIMHVFLCQGKKFTCDMYDLVRLVG